jgi:hypothetical protein
MTTTTQSTALATIQPAASVPSMSNRLRRTELADRAHL